jgi:chromosome segregation ATPase
MSAVHDSFTQLEAAVITLRNDLATEQERVRKLEQENEELRKQFFAIKKERDEFHKSICWLMNRDEKLEDVETWEKTIEEALLNPSGLSDLEDLIRELEGTDAAGQRERQNGN